MTLTHPEPRSLIDDVVHLAAVVPDPSDLHVVGTLRVKRGGTSVPVVCVFGRATPPIILGVSSARVAAADVRAERCRDPADTLRRRMFARRLVHMATAAETLAARHRGSVEARA